MTAPRPKGRGGCQLCEYDFDIADCDEHEEGPTEIYNKLNEVFCRGEDNGH